MTRTFDEQVAASRLAENPRWKGVTRDYTADVVRLRGRHPETRWPATAPRSSAADRRHGLRPCARHQRWPGYPARRPAFPPSTSAGRRRRRRPGLPRPVAVPRQLVPSVVAYINNALRRADQIEWSETDGNPEVDYMLPIVADEAGFGGRSTPTNP